MGGPGTGRLGGTSLVAKVADISNTGGPAKANEWTAKLLIEFKGEGRGNLRHLALRKL